MSEWDDEQCGKTLELAGKGKVKLSQIPKEITDM